MKKLMIATAALLAAMTFSANAGIRLCTGPESGVYAAAGGEIQKMSNGAVDIFYTEGTIDNMTRMLETPATDPAACDAMIGQPDGPVYLNRTSPAKAKKIRQVASLHREYLHGICNTASGVDDIGDLENDPSKYKIAIGEPGSGAWLVWQNLVAEDEDYGEVPVSNEGGVLALSSVSTGDATCMLVPAGKGNGTVQEADATYGDSVTLVGANDGDFDDATDLKGDPLYSYAAIPTDKYPITFNRYWSSPKTISWLAGVYVNTDRVKGKDLADFVKAASRAAIGIKAEYGK